MKNVLIALICLLAAAHGQSPIKPPTPFRTDAEMATCSNAVALARKLGQIREAQVLPPSTTSARTRDIVWYVVDGPAFLDMPYSEKVLLMANVNCALTGRRRDKSLAFDIRDWRTDEIIAHFENLALTFTGTLADTQARAASAEEKDPLQRKIDDLNDEIRKGQGQRATPLNSNQKPPKK